MIFNNLSENSLKKKTIDLFKKEILENTINLYQLHCKCILILDNTSSKLISKYLDMSEVINSGIFSVESIYKKRKPYKSYGAIYLISSSHSSIKLILNDFKSEKKRKYKWCFLFIINKINDDILELLLNKKFIKRIKILNEVDLNYIPLDKNYFYFGENGNFNPIYHLYANEEDNKVLNKLEVSKIMSVCKVTKTYPNIVYYIHDPLCKKLALKLNKKLKKYFENVNQEKNGILLITSRKLDLCAPIQFDLTYSHLLMELYKAEEKKEDNSIKINLEGKEENIILNHKDTLYTKYKVLDLSSLMTILNNDIEKFMKSDMSKLEKREQLNLEEMNIAMKNIEEYKYLSPLYAKHLKIVEDINKKSIERNIMNIIDFQSTIISGANYKGKKKGANHISKKVLENKNNFKKDDFLRLLCIIKYYNKESDINNLIQNIEIDNTIKFTDDEKKLINFFSQENTNINAELLKNTDKYIVLHRNKYKYNTEEEKENNKDKRYLCIKESKITTLCDMCCKNELPKDIFEYLESPKNIEFQKNDVNFFIENNIKEEKEYNQNLILYNIGGLSNYEISSIDKSNEIGQFSFNIIYGSNKIFNYKEYFEEINQYFQGNNELINDIINDDNKNIVMNDNKSENDEKININKNNKKKKNKKKSDDDCVKIEMSNINENDKTEEDNINNNIEEKKIKKKKKKKKIEMDNIINDDNNLKEPLNSDEDMK